MEIQMEVCLTDITNYADFLINERGLYISMHGAISSFAPLTRYNFHRHPLCLYVKTVCNLWDKCISRQKKVFAKAEDGEFFGMCHAGVGEYVYPLRCGRREIGFISVSGYRADGELMQIKQQIFAEKYGVSIDELREEAKTLSAPPDKKAVDCLVRPLVLMCEQYYERNIGSLTANFGSLSHIIQYVNENRTAKITMEHLGKKFGYSVSYLSHLFKKQTGQSLSEYIEGLRIEDAKWLLTQPNLKVTDVSAILGFGSSAYFSLVFKRKTGQSPKEYKKENGG